MADSGPADDGAPRGNEAWLEALVQNSSDIITVLDAEGCIVYSSPAAQRVLGYPDGYMQGQSAFELVHPDDVAHVVEAFLSIAETGSTACVEFRMLHTDGSWRRVEAVGMNRLDEPAVRGVVVNTRDVTERSEAEAALREEKERYRLLVEWSPEVIAVYQDRRFVFVNPAGLRLFGAEGPEQLLGRHVMDMVHPEDRAMVEARARAVAEGTETSLGEQRLLRVDGEVVDAEVVAVPITYDLGPAVLVMAKDITDRKRAERALAHQALHDHLTGLPNRSLLLDRLSQAVARLGRTDARVGVLFFDLDHFKVINDSLGHEAGDRVLQAVAARVAGVLRPTDTLARLGGDEFVVVCEALDGPAEASAVAARIARALARPIDEGDEELIVGASIGVVVTGDERADPSALIRDADAAMYRAKEQGRGRSELFDEGMRVRVVGRLRQERALRRALQREELLLHYQPVLALPDLQITGVEALVRWQDRERGLLLPGEFVPLAEETGLILELGDWVLAEACRQAAAWCHVLGAERTLEVAVNLSTKQLGQADLAKRVAGLLERHRLLPEQVSLCLEITESLMLEDPMVTGGLLGDLARLGVRLAIDDFGTGYSSLAYLRRFPVHTLKVDRSFVSGLGVDADSRAVVAAIIELAHALGLEVVAEGVEEQVQFDALVDLGCDRAQGFLFARPAPPEALAELLSPARPCRR
jgi:diguanylate cyclase (GGDEF)-like protein/PAS domain S-box-containing protein